MRLARRGLCLAFALAACSPPSSREAGAPWSSLRLTDRCEGADIDSAWEPEARAGRVVLQKTRFADLAPPATARLEGAWAAPYLLGRTASEDEECVLRVAQVPWSGQPYARVEVTCDEAPADDDAWFGIPVAEPLAPHELGEKARWISRFDRPRDLVRLRPAGEHRFLAVGEAPPGTRAILCVAIGSATAVDRARVEIAAIDPRSTWFEGTERTDLSPFVRRVGIDEVMRESLVLGTPGTARFRLRLPAGAPRFRAFGADPFADATVPLRVEVSVDDGDQRLRGSTTVETREWHALELDLTPLAGRDVELVLSVTGRRGTFGVIGQPEVVSAPREPLPLDLIVVSLDTVRADRTSLHGGTPGTTPTLERLAESAVVFDAAIAAAPWTLPAHVSMFSGLYPDRHGVTRTLGRVGDRVPWLAEELRSAGYRTLAFAASGYVDPEFGFARGFERYGTRDPVNPPLEWARQLAERGDETHLARATRSAAQRERLLEVLREERDRPLFLFLHTYQAHDYHAPPETLRAFGAASDEVDALLEGVYFKGSPYLANEIPPADLDVLRRRSSVMYDAALSLADAFVGDVVRALEESGRWERTILVVTSDHGEELFDRGAFGHGKSVHEELVRVPLLVRVPGAPPRRVAEVVSHVDLAPTLRGLLGRDAPGDGRTADGQDLSPVWDGVPVETRAALSRGGGRSGSAPVVRALRGRRHKVVESRVDGERDAVALYDLVDDPLERRDLAGERPEDAARLVDRLERHVEALRALAAGSSDAEPSAELLETLGELGYLDGPGARGPGGAPQAGPGQIRNR